MAKKHKKTPSSRSLVVWILTDMEGLAGVDDWDQCYDPDDHSPKYLHGREQLTADVNAAIAGCFDAGADEVRLLDGHGRNRKKGFIKEKLDPRANTKPLDSEVNAVACIGQHAMVGTLHGFIDHTQTPKEICRFFINGKEHGELSQLAMEAGGWGIPLLYASGDEALCQECHRLFPWVVTTPTKKGTGFNSCELYPVTQVRANIRKDMARALRNRSKAKLWKPRLPAEIKVEWAWSGLADEMVRIPGVHRVDARTVRWKIKDAREVYHFPSPTWQPTA